MTTTKANSLYCSGFLRRRYRLNNPVIIDLITFDPEGLAMLTILVNIIGVILIAGIIWWFWISKPRARQITGNTVEIIVDNGVYTPSRIVVKAGQPVILNFIRKDPSPCAEKVVFDSLDIIKDLPLDTMTRIELNPDRGEYTFTCQMQMYRGSLVVEE